jgi:hypothetical protein
VLVIAVTVPQITTPCHSWVNLNVGGRVFCTTRGTLTAAGDNMLAHMFGSNWQVCVSVWLCEITQHRTAVCY